MGPVAGCLRAAVRAVRNERRPGLGLCAACPPTGDGARVAAPVEHVGPFQRCIFFSLRSSSSGGRRLGDSLEREKLENTGENANPRVCYRLIR